MLQALAPRHRPLTLILLAISGPSVIAAAVIGVSDNPPGILLAYVAAGAFALACVHPWRAERPFRLLAAGSLFGFIICLGLAALLDIAVKRLVPAGAFRAVLGGLFGAVFMLVVIVLPAAFVVAVLGGIAVVIRDVRRSRRTGYPGGR